MTREFHSRFKIEVPVSEARRRFVNRALNRVFERFMLDLDNHREAKREIVSALGDRFYDHKDVSQYIGENFHSCLLALQALYDIIPWDSEARLDELIHQLIAEAETDVDVRWRDGTFYPAGARELDEELVNFNLDWLEEQGLDTVLAPFRKGLRHFLEAQSRPELLHDVITDMYESFEAMIKLVTGRSRADLGSRKEFLDRFGGIGLLSLTKEYGEYAHSFRHSEDPVNRRVAPTEAEVEAFVYLTGLFLRLSSHMISREGG
jgi:hypothetical protein